MYPDLSAETEDLQEYIANDLLEISHKRALENTGECFVGVLYLELTCGCVSTVCIEQPNLQLGVIMSVESLAVLE